MSQLNVTSLKHEGASGDNITLSSNGSVGVGTSSPTSQISFGSTIGKTLAVFENAGGNNIYGIGMTGDGGTNNPYRTRIFANGFEYLSVDYAGRVTMPYQPSFKVRFANSSYQLPGGTVIWDTADFNVGSHYNTSTGFFTAPVAGRYQINLNAQHYGGSSGSGWIDIRKNNGQVQCRLEDYNGATYTARGISVVLDLAVGDYVSAFNGTSGIWWADNSTFSGYLIG